MRTLPHRAFTRIELLIVVVVVALVASLAVIGIQQTRDTAARMQSINNLWKIAAATHCFQDAHGRPPDRLGSDESANPGESVLLAVFPFLEADDHYRRYKTGRLRADDWRILLYESPADPSLRRGALSAASSYAANAHLFTRTSRLPDDVPDGMTHTILFAEHYAAGCREEADAAANPSRIIFGFLTIQPANGRRRTTFADNGDVGEARADPRLNTMKFQVRPRVYREGDPRPDDCLSELPQTPHSSGMLSALADGSVRTLSPSMTPRTFWNAVWPDDGTPLGSDW